MSRADRGPSTTHSDSGCCLEYGWMGCWICRSGRRPPSLGGRQSVKFGLLARGQGRNLGGEAFGLETEETLEPAHCFLSFVQLVSDSDMLLRPEGLSLY
jgi:hypothetical protein